MVTYSDLFTFVIMLCSVIALILAIFQNKKQRPCSGKVRRYFLQPILPAVRLHLTNGSLVKYIIAILFKICQILEHLQCYILNIHPQRR